MECNKDEALRAKEIAEKKFSAKDISGAKKFAIKAHNLYPGLEGISQMLTTFDVYLSAESKINGERDWYGILSVKASADDETVKKQYRKLALVLHPDKNKSIGADGAFKLLSEAWSVLSDQGRRTAYDQKINVRRNTPKASQPKRDASASTFNGSSFNFAHSSSRTQKDTTQAPPPPPPPPPAQPPAAPPSSSRQSKQGTFWTACHRCKMQYEYLRVYLNHNLLCPNCHEPFLALETAHPTNGSHHPSPWPSRQQNSYHNPPSNTSSGAGRSSSAAGPSARTTGYSHGVGLNSSNHTNFQWGAFSRSTSFSAATASSSAAANSANMAHHTYEKVGKEKEETQAASKWHGHSSKRTHSGSNVGNSSGTPSNNVTNIPKVDRPVKKRRGYDDNGRADRGVNDVDQGLGVNKCGNDNERANGVLRSTTGYAWTRELSMLETRNMLLQKSRKGLGKKISDVNIVKETRTTVTVAACVKDKSDGPTTEPKQDLSRKSSPDGSTTKPEPKATVQEALTYPDPEFHDFDKDRSEKSFKASQVWAAYDDDDGMPRYYALIHNVISLKPFKLQFSWLNSKSNSELGPLNWVASGFCKTCGEFRVGRYEISNNVNVFSHRVRWEKGIRGVFKVFPRKADVWALYRNWAPNWNETTPDEVIHKYDMVEVLEDYNEEVGVLVAPLVKVAGFKTIFHRHMDPKEIKRIPREEIFQLSHQVPSRLLTGEEAPTAPKGCLELDPAATPLELLQVITEAKEKDEVVVIGEQKPFS